MRTREEVQHLKNYFIRLKFFDNLLKDNDQDEEVISECCKQLQYRKYYKHDFICKYGEEGHEFYILMKGRVNVIVPVADEKPNAFPEKHLTIPSQPPLPIVKKEASSGLSTSRSLAKSIFKASSREVSKNK